VAVADPEALHCLVTEILVAAGAPADVAEGVAASLIGANLTGHDSHGVMKLPSYVRDIRAGKLDPTARPEVIHESVTTAVVDGNAGFGHLGARFASDLAVQKASASGIACVTARHLHHTGRLGNWSERIAAAGMIGMLMGGEAQPPYMVAPYGGRAGALATNPLTWAIPRDGEPPVVLDFATSTVSIGKLQIARNTEVEVPDGWILDAEGRPTSRLDDFFDGGLLLPFGTYKGYALAVIVELLTIGLSGGRDVPAGHRSSCLLVMAIDPKAFDPVGDLASTMDETIRRMRAVAPADEAAPVMTPGEPEHAAREARRGGIPVADANWEALWALAAELGIEHRDVEVRRPEG
jgi:hydroxycarboxylate dehydrogenase B